MVKQNGLDILLRGVVTNPAIRGRRRGQICLDLESQRQIQPQREQPVEPQRHVLGSAEARRKRQELRHAAAAVNVAALTINLVLSHGRREARARRAIQRDGSARITRVCFARSRLAGGQQQELRDVRVGQLFAGGVGEGLGEPPLEGRGPD